MDLLASLLDVVYLSAATFTIMRGWFLSDYTAAWREHARVRRDDPISIVRLAAYTLTCPPCLCVATTILLSATLVLPFSGRQDISGWLLKTLAAAAFVPTSLFGDRDGRSDGI